MANGRQARAWSLLATITAGAVAGLVLINYLSPETSPMSSGEQALAWPNGTQPICVGRFLVDLPKEFRFEGSKAASGSAAVTMSAQITEAEFRRQLMDRWQSISGRSSAGPSSHGAAKPESINIEPNVFLLNFDHVATRGPDVTGKVGEWSIYSSEAHVWRDGTYFLIDGADEPEVRSTLAKLQPTSDATLPTGEGLCGIKAFFPGGARAEFVRASFRLFPIEELSLQVSSSTYVDALGLRMLRPVKQLPESIGDAEDIKGRTIRTGTSTAGGMRGEEWIVGFTEKLPSGGYSTSITAHWFAEGEPGSASRPATSLRLSYAVDTPEPPAKWGQLPNKPIKEGALTEPEFLAVWHSLQTSFRLRPGAL